MCSRCSTPGSNTEHSNDKRCSLTDSVWRMKHSVSTINNFDDFEFRTMATPTLTHYPGHSHPHSFTTPTPFGKLPSGWFSNTLTWRPGIQSSLHTTTCLWCAVSKSLVDTGWCVFICMCPGFTQSPLSTCPGDGTLVQPILSSYLWPWSLGYSKGWGGENVRSYLLVCIIFHWRAIVGTLYLSYLCKWYTLKCDFTPKSLSILIFNQLWWRIWGHWASTCAC